MYHDAGEAAFSSHIKHIEEAVVDSIDTNLRLRGTSEWTEMLVKVAGQQFRADALDALYL